MNNNNKIVIAAVAGVAVGALIGIFFAPDKGSDTRKKFAKGLEGKLKVCKEKCNDLKEDIEQTIKKKAEEFSA